MRFFFVLFDFLVLGEANFVGEDNGVRGARLAFRGGILTRRGRLVSESLGEGGDELSGEFGIAN